jgi:virginiamycin B lyase
VVFGSEREQGRQNYPVGTITEYTLPGANPGQRGIAAGPDSNLWLIESTANKIARITPAGTIAEHPIPTANSSALGITTGRDGNLWFTESGANKIGCITPAGAVTEYAIPFPNSSSPHIAVDASGNVWFRELNRNAVGLRTASRAFAEFLVPTAGAAPWGIAVVPDGHIWYAENAGNKMGRISPAITVKLAATDHFRVSVPFSTTAGVPLSVTVTALDSYGDIATGYAVPPYRHCPGIQIEPPARTREKASICLSSRWISRLLPLQGKTSGHLGLFLMVEFRQAADFDNDM